MTLQLNCSMCNGHIEPDDLAIRKGIVVCLYCSTINRVVSTGTKTVDGSIPDQYAPKTVKIIHGEGESLDVTVARQEVASSHNDVNKGLTALGLFTKLSAFLAAWIFVFALMGIGIDIALNTRPYTQSIVAVVWILLFFLGAPIIGGAIIVFTVFRINRLGELSPLTIKDGYLYPASSDSSPVQLTNIRQIFATFTKIEYPIIQDYHVQPKPSIYCTVFAFTNDGERVSLVGPLVREEVALYIEEYLEAELHLHDLPVFGDFRTDVKTDQSKFELAAPQNPGEPMECFSCGATLLKSELIVKQGYVVCDYCQSLTLLYKPDMPYPVLGLPDVHAVHLQIKLKQEGANFVLTEDDNDRPVQWVQIESEFLVVQKVDQDFQAIHTTDVTKIFVKAFDTKEAVERENLEQISLPEMSDLLEGYAEAVSKEEAYSGDIDAEKMVRNVRFGVQYRVVAQMSDGNLICLLDNLADVREAVLWSEFMCEKCGVSSEDTHLIF